MFNFENKENNKTEKKQKINNKIKHSYLLICLFLCSCFVIGFVGGAIAYNFFSEPNGNVSLENLSSSLSSGNVNTLPLTTSQVVELVEDSVVEIRTEILSSGSNSSESLTEGAGSGVVLKQDGYIVTNAHVIDDAKNIKVKLHNGDEYAANLVGKDEKEDIAVIKINANGLTPITFGDSQELKVGERVIVIGNPLGTLGGSVTDGIISAINRTLNINGEDMTLLQTNAEINHGNSGGGMFGEKGQFVGLVVAKSTGMNLEGLGFAIPSNTVKDVVNKLM